MPSRRSRRWRGGSDARHRTIGTTSGRRLLWDRLRRRPDDRSLSLQSARHTSDKVRASPQACSGSSASPRSTYMLARSRRTPRVPMDRSELRVSWCLVPESCLSGFRRRPHRPGLLRDQHLVPRDPARGTSSQGPAGLESRLVQDAGSSLFIDHWEWSSCVIASWSCCSLMSPITREIGKTRRMNNPSS